MPSPSQRWTTHTHTWREKREIVKTKTFSPSSIITAETKNTHRISHSSKLAICNTLNPFWIVIYTVVSLFVKEFFLPDWSANEMLFAANAGVLQNTEFTTNKCMEIFCIWKEPLNEPLIFKFTQRVFLKKWILLYHRFIFR